MALEEVIFDLNQDLKNEWKHMRFYLHHASRVQGLHCNEYKELFLEEAASEMKHITEFSDLIVGLGGIPTTESNDFPCFTKPKDILSYALNMENEVVVNYALRISQAELLDCPNNKWVTIFLENQIEHSRADADHMKQILKGI